MAEAIRNIGNEENGDPFDIGQTVMIKLTGEGGMVIGHIINSEMVYLVRLKNYAEVAFRRFELESLED